MNLHIILHAIIILLVLHILIKNIDMHFTIGDISTIYEKFTNTLTAQTLGLYNKKNTTQSPSTADIMDDNNDNNDDNDSDNSSIHGFKNYLDANKQKLLNEVKKVTNNIDMKATNFEALNETPFKPSNYYIHNENVPNFGSNVINPAQYYNINPPNNNYQPRSCNTTEQPQISNMTMAQNNILNPVSNLTYNNNPSPLIEDNRISTQYPATWEYKNELVMNGGEFTPNLVGYDEISNEYAPYNIQSNNIQPTFNVKYDDLRKGQIV